MGKKIDEEDDSPDRGGNTARNPRGKKDLSEATIWQVLLICELAEDYLKESIFSRLLTLKYGNSISNYLWNELRSCFCRACNTGVLKKRTRDS